MDPISLNHLLELRSAHIGGNCDLHILYVQAEAGRGKIAIAPTALTPRNSRLRAVARSLGYDMRHATNDDASFLVDDTGSGGVVFKSLSKAHVSRSVKAVFGPAAEAAWLPVRPSHMWNIMYADNGGDDIRLIGGYEELTVDGTQSVIRTVFKNKSVKYLSSGGGNWTVPEVPDVFNRLFFYSNKLFKKPVNVGRCVTRIGADCGNEVDISEGGRVSLYSELGFRLVSGSPISVLSKRFARRRKELTVVKNTIGGVLTSVNNNSSGGSMVINVPLRMIRCTAAASLGNSGMIMERHIDYHSAGQPLPPRGTTTAAYAKLLSAAASAADVLNLYHSAIVLLLMSNEEYDSTQVFYPPDEVVSLARCFSKALTGMFEQSMENINFDYKTVYATAKRCVRSLNLSITNHFLRGKTAVGEVVPDILRFSAVAHNIDKMAICDPSLPRSHLAELMVMCAYISARPANECGVYAVDKTMVSGGIPCTNYILHAVRDMAAVHHDAPLPPVSTIRDDNYMAFGGIYHGSFGTFEPKRFFTMPPNVTVVIPTLPGSVIDSKTAVMFRCLYEYLVRDGKESVKRFITNTRVKDNAFVWMKDGNLGSVNAYVDNPLYLEEILDNLEKFLEDYVSTPELRRLETIVSCTDPAFQDGTFKSSFFRPTSFSPGCKGVPDIKYNIETDVSKAADQIWYTVEPYIGVGDLKRQGVLYEEPSQWASTRYRDLVNITLQQQGSASRNAAGLVKNLPHTYLNNLENPSEEKSSISWKYTTSLSDVCEKISKIAADRGTDAVLFISSCMETDSYRFDQLVMSTGAKREDMMFPIVETLLNNMPVKVTTAASYDGPDRVEILTRQVQYIHSKVCLGKKDNETEQLLPLDPAMTASDTSIKAWCGDNYTLQQDVARKPVNSYMYKTAAYGEAPVMKMRDTDTLSKTRTR